MIGVYITWNCDLDWSFLDYCLPTYSFRILDTFGWNFRHAYYHEENRRTLIKAYGLKFLVVVDGRASKFDLKNTVIVLVTGLGLLGLSTMFCDFILLNYSTDRRRVSHFNRKQYFCGSKNHFSLIEKKKTSCTFVFTFFCTQDVKMENICLDKTLFPQGILLHLFSHYKQINRLRGFNQR